MSVKQDKRRHIQRVAAGTIESVVNQLNRVLVNLDERISQVDAIGQNPDFKGKTLKNVGNLSGVAYLSITATLPDVIGKLNEVIEKFDGGV